MGSRAKWKLKRKSSGSKSSKRATKARDEGDVPSPSQKEDDKLDAPSKELIPPQSRSASPSTPPETPPSPHSSSLPEPENRKVMPFGIARSKTFDLGDILWLSGRPKIPRMYFIPFKPSATFDPYFNDIGSVDPFEPTVNDAPWCVESSIHTRRNMPQETDKPHQIIRDTYIPDDNGRNVYGKIVREILENAYDAPLDDANSPLCSTKNPKEPPMEPPIGFSRDRWAELDEQADSIRRECRQTAAQARFRRSSSPTPTTPPKPKVTLKDSINDMPLLAVGECAVDFTLLSPSRKFKSRTTSLNSTAPPLTPKRSRLRAISQLRGAPRAPIFMGYLAAPARTWKKTQRQRLEICGLRPQPDSPANYIGRIWGPDPMPEEIKVPPHLRCIIPELIVTCPDDEDSSKHRHGGGSGEGPEAIEDPDVDEPDAENGGNAEGGVVQGEPLSQEQVLQLHVSGLLIID